MKIRVLALSFFWTLLTLTDLCGQSSDHIQESRYKSFQVLIISPDTARIHDSLTTYAKLIEENFRSSFAKRLREFESKRDVGDDEEKEQIELMINQAKWHESDVVRFRYYNMISIATFFSPQEYFQKYPWEKEKSLTCQIIAKKGVKTVDLMHLANNYGFDYIKYFGNIHADKYANSFITDMTTYLFSKADSKVIMKRTTHGEADELFCDLISQQNPLECMMTRITNEATSDLFKVLSERQKK